MSNRKKSKGTIKSICSPGSLDGRKPSDLQDGQQTGLFGQSVAPAPHSRLQDTPQSAPAAKADVLCGALDELATQYALTAEMHGLPMPGTYGRKHGDLSRTYDRARSLGSKLQVLMGSGGSPLYRLRWKFSAMPLSGWICRLRASGRRISGKDFSGWPTPNASNADRLGYQDMEKLAKRMATRQNNLQEVVMLEGWPTPNVPNGGRSISHAEQKGGTFYHEGKKVQFGLEGAAKMAGWTSPRPSDDNQTRRTNKSMEREINRPGRGSSLAIDAYQAGTTSNSSPAPTEKRGSLNPAFVRWLMGFPEEWDDCADMETP